MPRQGRHQGEGMLGRGDVVALGRVDDHDAPGGGRGHVDVVDPDARPADHAQLARGIEDIARHLGSAADHQPVSVANLRQELGRRCIRQIHDLDSRSRLEHGKPLAGERIGDEHLGHVDASWMGWWGRTYNSGTTPWATPKWARDLC